MNFGLKSVGETSALLRMVLQGIPAFRDFTIRDPRYFMILFQWKSAKKVDFSNFFKVRFLTVLIRKQYYITETVLSKNF